MAMIAIGGLCQRNRVMCALARIMALLPKQWKWYNRLWRWKMVENFDKMLAGSLRLEDSWYIIGAKFNEEESVIHILKLRTSKIYANI